MKSILLYVNSTPIVIIPKKNCECFATLECVILLPGSTGWGTVCLKILTRPHIRQLGCNNPGKCNWKWNLISLKFLPLQTQNQYEKYFSLFSHQNYQTKRKDELADLLSFHDYFVLFRPVDSNHLTICKGWLGQTTKWTLRAHLNQVKIHSYHWWLCNFKSGF